MGEKVERVTQSEDIIGYLLTIVFLKRALPFNLRGWLNLLGLHVQLREVGGSEWLRAGGKFKSYFDAVNRNPSNLAAYVGEGMARHWQIKRFDKRTWDVRFAHLVEPAFDVAQFVSSHMGAFDEQAATTLTSVVRHFKATGQWLGLPSGDSCPACDKHMTIGQWRRESCPYCGAKLQQS